MIFDTNKLRVKILTESKCLKIRSNVSLRKNRK